MSRENPPAVLAFLGYHHRLDGASRSFLNLLVRLPDHGYRPVAVFVGEGVCAEAYRNAGVEVRILRAPAAFDQFNKQWLGRSGALRRLPALVFGLPSLARQVRKLLRSEHAVIAHFNESRAFLSLAWAPLLLRIPTVLHVRGSLRPLPRPLRRLVEALPTRLVLVGELLRREFRHSVARKAVTIHNSVSGGLWAEPIKDDGERPLEVLTLAAFEPFKGYHHLAEAAAAVTARLAPRQVNFRWFGNVVDPDYDEYLRKRIDELGLRNVSLSAWIADVTGELERADLVVLATVDDELLELGGRKRAVRSSEGVPRCLLEASATGRAVVSTRVGGIPEAMIPGETGILVPPSDAPALADAIYALLVAPSEREAMGRRGAEYVATDYSHDRLVTSVAGLYDAITAGTARRVQ